MAKENLDHWWMQLNSQIVQDYPDDKRQSAQATSNLEHTLERISSGSLRRKLIISMYAETPASSDLAQDLRTIWINSLKTDSTILPSYRTGALYNTADGLGAPFFTSPEVAPYLAAQLRQDCHTYHLQNLMMPECVHYLPHLKNAQLRTLVIEALANNMGGIDAQLTPTGRKDFAVVAALVPDQKLQELAGRLLLKAPLSVLSELQTDLRKLPEGQKLQEPVAQAIRHTVLTQAQINPSLAWTEIIYARANTRSPGKSTPEPIAQAVFEVFSALANMAPERAAREAALDIISSNDPKPTRLAELGRYQAALRTLPADRALPALAELHHQLSTQPDYLKPSRAGVVAAFGQLSPSDRTRWLEPVCTIALGDPLLRNAICKAMSEDKFA